MPWWKGNIHTHSLWSDGNDFPEMIADWYRSHDYHFLALSDHNILSEGVRWMSHDQIIARGGKDVMKKYRDRFGDDWVETRGQTGTKSHAVRLKPLNEFRTLLEKPGEFLMMPGEEISDRAEGRPVHMNATNLKRLIAPLGGATVREAMTNNLRAAEQQAQKEGREILVHLNHPNFGYAVTAEDLAAVLAERFFEVYNGHPGVNQLGDAQHAGVERIWDIANTLRIAKFHAPPLWGVGTDDSHHYHGRGGSRTGRGWVMVQAQHLKPESLIKAMKAGRFYASSGVELEKVSLEKFVLQLKIKPQPKATYVTQFIATTTDYDGQSQPVLDKNGKPVRATRRYSVDVGKVLATAKGLNPQYKLTGKELYVRAVVTSSLPHRDPSYKNQKRQAWTQPAGWEKHLEK